MSYLGTFQPSRQIQDVMALRGRLKLHFVRALRVLRRSARMDWRRSSNTPAAIKARRMRRRARRHARAKR